MIEDGFTPEERVVLLQELKKLRYTGAKSIEFRDRKVVVRSDAELASAIARLEEEISARTPGRRPSGAILTNYGSGL